MLMTLPPPRSTSPEPLFPYPTLFRSTLIVSIMAVFCAMFQHANLKTPYWLGFIVTRPESHALHHERGVHAWNYGDIPLWDMLFGTFRNPPRWNGEAGFHEGSTHQWSMLLGRKVA